MGNKASKATHKNDPREAVVTIAVMSEDMQQDAIDVLVSLVRVFGCLGLVIGMTLLLAIIIVSLVS